MDARPKAEPLDYCFETSAEPREMRCYVPGGTCKSENLPARLQKTIPSAYAQRGGRNFCRPFALPYQYALKKVVTTTCFTGTGSPVWMIFQQAARGAWNRALWPAGMGTSNLVRPAYTNPFSKLALANLVYSVPSDGDSVNPLFAIFETACCCPAHCNLFPGHTNASHMQNKKFRRQGKAQRIAGAFIQIHAMSEEG